MDEKKHPALSGLSIKSGADTYGREGHARSELPRLPHAQASHPYRSFPFLLSGLARGFCRPQHGIMLGEDHVFSGIGLVAGRARVVPLRRRA